MKTDIKLFLLNKLMDYHKDISCYANGAGNLLRLFSIEADSKEIENAMNFIKDARDYLRNATECLQAASDQITNTLIFEEKIIS